MSFQIDFEKKETYESIKIGITIDAVLRYGESEVICPAKVDTGSEFCLFARTFADALNIDLESGYRENFSTLGGGIIGYAHQIELETLGLRFQSYIYFAENYFINRSLLGRQDGFNFSKSEFMITEAKSICHRTPNREQFS